MAPDVALTTGVKGPEGLVSGAAAVPLCSARSSPHNTLQSLVVCANFSLKLTNFNLLD